MDLCVRGYVPTTKRSEKFQQAAAPIPSASRSRGASTAASRRPQDLAPASVKMERDRNRDKGASFYGTD